MTRRPTLRALLLALAASGCAQEKNTAPPAGEPEIATPQATAPVAPLFEDYPAGKVEGIESPAPVDLSSHPEARHFRTMLRRGTAAGPNFAGSYTVVTWGCGTMCQRVMIVDARSGRVFEGPTVPLGVEYRLGSRLLVVNPPEAVRENPCPLCETGYYVWNGEGLERIGPGPAPEVVRQRAWVDSLRLEEARRLRPHAPAVQRPADDRLVITAADGARRVFRDERMGEHLQSLHLFRGYFEPLDHYQVEVIYVPEGGQQLLVAARTGEITEVDAPPVPSPDGQRFITASLDLVAGHQPNRLRIYRMEGGAPVREWELAPREWGGTNPRWEDARTISLERAEVDWSTRPLRLRSSPMRLELREGGWTMTTPAEPRQALLGFFRALRERRYADALELYGGSYEVLEGWNPYHDPADRAGLWRAACEGNGLECFHGVEVLREEEVSPGEYHLTVHFLTPTGEVWRLGPCCGATEEEMPPVSEFTFTVRRAAEGFQVHTLPVYMP